MKSPLLIALTDRINLSILALSIASGLCAAWWWAPVGLLLWAIMVIIVARDPSLQMAKNLDSRAPLAQRFQSQFKSVERAQISIFNNISHADRKMRPVLQPIQDATDELVDYTHGLCQRMTVLENHRLVSTSMDDLKGQISDIDALLSLTSDSLTTREYTESRQALVTRLENLQAVERQLGRTDAQLASLTNELNRVLTEIVRLQAGDPASAKERVDRVVEAIETQLGQLRDFELEVSQL